MKPELASDKSIYLQIAEGIEDDIMQGNIKEEEQVPSTNQLAVIYLINPATAAKGINMLVSEGIIYKKRGIGMFVSKGASKTIKKKRKTAFHDNYIVRLLEEASNLEISKEEIIEMINNIRKK